MLGRVRTQRRVKFSVGERQVINAVDLYEVRQLSVPDDVRIHAATVRRTAADIQVPALPLDDIALEVAVTVPVQEYDDAGHCRGQDKEIKHGEIFMRSEMEQLK